MAIAIKRNRPAADPYLTSGLTLAVVFCGLFWAAVAIGVLRLFSALG